MQRSVRHSAASPHKMPQASSGTAGITVSSDPRFAIARRCGDGQLAVLACNLTVSLFITILGWFGEAAGASGQTRDEGDGNASSDGGDRVLHVALRSDGQPLADGNLGVGQVS